MVSGMKVGWFVVGVVSLLAALAVVAGPSTVRMPRRRPAVRQPNSLPKAPFEVTRPTVVRMRPVDASVAPIAAPIGETLALDSEFSGVLTDHGSPAPWQADTTEPARPTLAGRPTGGDGSRFLRALFPRGSSGPAPKSPTELSPPSVNVPAGMDRTVR